MLGRGAGRRRSAPHPVPARPISRPRRPLGQVPAGGGLDGTRADRDRGQGGPRGATRRAGRRFRRIARNGRHRSPPMAVCRLGWQGEWNREQRHRRNQGSQPADAVGPTLSPGTAWQRRGLVLRSRGPRGPVRRTRRTVLSSRRNRLRVAAMPSIARAAQPPSAETLEAIADRCGRPGGRGGGRRAHPGRCAGARDRTREPRTVRVFGAAQTVTLRTSARQDRETVWDLASLTKVLLTTRAVLAPRAGRPGRARATRSASTFPT